MLNGSNLIKGRWKIIRRIGAGAFGEIYAAKNIITSELVAIKVEKVDSKKQILKAEVAALKRLQACPNVCRFITCGRYNEYNYLVMELLGDNLSELRRKAPTGKFSMATTLLLGIVFVRSLQQMHDLGYLHRDVKPSNFVIGAEGRRNQVYLIDFGLARKFTMPDGSIRPAREQAGFRGTARYASINSHLSKDLGRRDDLWSVFYILVESAKGFLPWRKLKEKDEIRDIKIKMNTPELCDELPKEFVQFMDHLQALEYSDRPDYDYLIQLLQHRLQLIGASDKTPYDWEASSSSTSEIPPGPDLSASNRPGSTGRPVVSGEGDPHATSDPDNAPVYKLVAGGRRAQPINSDEEHGSAALSPDPDSAEEAHRAADNSDLGVPDEDEVASGSDRPNSGTKPAATNTSADIPPENGSDVEMEEVKKPDTSETNSKQPHPPHQHRDGTTKCKCIIL